MCAQWLLAFISQALGPVGAGPLRISVWRSMAKRRTRQGVPVEKQTSSLTFTTLDAQIRSTSVAAIGLESPATDPPGLTALGRLDRVTAPAFRAWQSPHHMAPAATRNHWGGWVDWAGCWCWPCTRPELAMLASLPSASSSKEEDDDVRWCVSSLAVDCAQVGVRSTVLYDVLHAAAEL